MKEDNSKSKLYTHVRNMYKNGGFWQDITAFKCRQIYRTIKTSRAIYEDKKSDTVLFFDWLASAEPQELETKFSCYEIIELLQNIN